MSSEIGITIKKESAFFAKKATCNQENGTLLMPFPILGGS
ncbi:hypothetical protein HMPREF2738_02133 [Clostridiales bacterium KLE1615]|nr:hypothetical protein HMPREF2738_02133 [Clostridiales bacterium KLE1615]